VAALLALAVVSTFELADRLGAPRRARLAVAEQTAALLMSRLEDIKRAGRSHGVTTRTGVAARATRLRRASIYLADLADGEAGDYRDPVADLPGAAAERYRGSWMATFAPVVGTDFVVIVQQR
jgi:hypothetical protein